MREIRIYGGIGVILGLLSVVPYGGLVFAIASIVLLFLAFKKLSEYFNNKSIFNKYLIWFILTIISTILAFIAIGSVGIGIFSLSSDVINQLAGFGILLLIICYIIEIIAAVNLRTCLLEVSQLTNISTFKTAGNLYLWGVITLILLVGAIILIIAYILLAVAFFALPETT